MASVCLILLAATSFLHETTAFELSQMEWNGEPPLLETRHDVNIYLNNIEQVFRVEMSKMFMKEYNKRSADAGVPQTQIDGLGSPDVHQGVDVQASDFFTLQGKHYAVISESTLNGSYIGLVNRAGNGTLQIQRQAQFSVESFVDHQYSAAFQTSLHRRVIRVKAHVFGGRVFILTELLGGRTLLFLIPDPGTSWLPKYQDSVLSPDEVASDFRFFEQTGLLFVVVTVSRRGQETPAGLSYIYRLQHGVKWLQTHTVSTAGGATSVTTFTDRRWTYIVIGQDAVQSLVYRLHWDLGTLELFQYLPTSGAVTVEAFIHHGQTYVLLVNKQGNASVFWWTSDQLFVWQDLVRGDGDPGPVQFGHVGSFFSGESFIYLVSGSTIAFYTTVGSETGHFSLASTHSLPAGTKIHHVQLTRVGRDGYYLMVSAESRESVVGWSVFPVIVREGPGGPRVSSPAGSGPLLSRLEEADQLVRQLDRQLDELLQLADSIWVRDSDRNVTAAVTVTAAVNVTGEADVTELQIVSHQSSGGNAGPVRLDDVHDQIASCEASISDINTGLQHALTASGKQLITGHYSFTNLVVNGSLFINDASHIDTVNGVAYRRLLESTLTFMGNQTLSYPLSVGSGAATSLTLTHGATVNGLVASDLMRVNGSQTVSGRHRYLQAGVTGALTLLGPLNRLPLSSLLQRGQTLTVESARLSRAAADVLLVTDVNQRELSAWQRAVLPLTRPLTLPGRLLGPSALFTDLRLTRVNGRPLDAFLSSLWRAPGGPVAGITTLLGPVSISGDLSAGRVNGVTLTSDLLTADTEQTVTSRLRLGSLRVTLDLVTDWVNGLDLSREVVRTAGQPATVAGAVLFAADLAVSGDVTLADDVTVNGVDLSEVPVLTSGSRRTLHFSRRVLLNGTWTVLGTVGVLSINGQGLGSLDDVFWNRDGQQNIDVATTIATDLSITHDLSVTTINGASPASFIDVRRGGKLNGDVIFLGSVTVNDVTVPAGGTVNGRQLSRFAASVVTRGGDQLVTGSKVLAGAVRTAGVRVRRLNGLRIPEELVMLDRDAVQTGSLTFLSDLEVATNVSSSGDVSLLGSINSHSVSDILANLTDVWVNRTENHVLVIEGNVHFHDIHVLERVNSGGVLGLLEGLLYADRDTRLPGAFTVHGDVRFNGPLSLNTANGRQWQPYLASLVLSDAGGSVAGTTTVTSVTVTRPADLRLTSLNGYTLPRLYSQYLTVHTRQLIRHRVTVHGSVSADVLNVNRVNGVPVNQLMFTDRDLHFYQRVHLFSELATAELGVPSGVIGSCNLTQIWDKGLRKSNASQTLSLPTTIDSLVVTGDVTLSHGDVIGQLVTLLDRLVTRTGNHSISGEVTFERPLSVTSAEVSTYNGLSLTGLCEEALTNDMSPVSLRHPLTVLGAVRFLGDVTVSGDVTVGRLNGEHVDGWLDSLVLRGDAEVTLGGPLRIQQAAVAGHVVAAGLINGQSPSAWVERDSNITVGRLYFDRGITIIDNLDVSGLVDGVNISDVFEAALGLTSDATIAADVTFSGNLGVRLHLTAPGVNSVRLPEDLLLSHRLDITQKVSGPKHFSTLLVNGGLCGRLNGGRLSQLCRGLLSSDPGAVQVVTRRLAFQHPPASLEGPSVGLADNLTAVTAKLRERKDEVAVWTEQLRTEIGQVLTSAEELLETPDFSVDLAYLLELQRLPVPSAAAVLSPGGDLSSLHVLLRSEVNCSLPAGCLCRATNTLQVQPGGRLRAPGVVSAGQRWTFHIRDMQQVVTVTAHTDGYSSRCRSPSLSRVSVTWRPAGDPSAPGRDLPLEAPPPGPVSAARLFSRGGELYLVLAYGVAHSELGTFPATELLLLTGSQWRVVQRLPAFGATGLDLTAAEGRPHLLVSNRYSREPLSLQGEIQLWEWDADLKQFSELRSVQHADVRAAAFLHAHEKVLVVIADLDGLTVLEYSAAERQYSVCQYLAEPGISALTSFTVGAESYLAVFSGKLNQLLVFLVTHQEGLRRHSVYPAAAVGSLAVYRSGHQLLLAAVHRHGLVVYRVVTRGRLGPATTADTLPTLN